MSNENPPCPDCGGKLVNKEWIPRGKKEAGGHRLIRIIERRRCVECGRSHRLLPDDQVPYKHYSAEVIEKVVDEDYEFIEEEALEYEDYPCEATMGRWRGKPVAVIPAMQRSVFPQILKSCLRQMCTDVCVYGRNTKNSTRYVSLTH